MGRQRRGEQVGRGGEAAYKRALPDRQQHQDLHVDRDAAIGCRGQDRAGRTGGRLPARVRAGPADHGADAAATHQRGV